MRPIACALAAALMLAAWPAFANPLHIVALGASNTRGWGVGGEHAYPAQLQAILRQRGIDARVRNAGVPLATTTNMLLRIDSAVPPGTNIVILQPGTNDRRFGRSPRERAANVSAIVEQLRRRNVRVIVFDQALPPRMLQWDGAHFTREGHAHIASLLAAQIVEMIGRN